MSRATYHSSRRRAILEALEATRETRRSRYSPPRLPRSRTRSATQVVPVGAVGEVRVRPISATLN